MPISGIYGIKNTTNGKWYIGQSVDVHSRRRGHFSDLRLNRHKNDHLQKAFNLYGGEAFEWHLLEVVSPELLDPREHAWMDFYHSLDERFGYNLIEWDNHLRVYPEESRRKISKALTGKKLSDETKRKIALAHIGKPHYHSPETRRKLSEAHKGKKVSQETRRRISVSLMGNKNRLGGVHT